MKEDPEHQETARKEILRTGTAKQRQEHLLKKKKKKLSWKIKQEEASLSSGGEDGLYSGTLVCF